MAETVFIFFDTLTNNLADCQSIVLKDDQQTIEPLAIRDAASLLALTVNRRITVVLPSFQVTHHLLTLPTLKKARFIIPNMLEENFSTDIDTIHFAFLAQPKMDGQHLVYAVENVGFEKLLAHLKQHQLYPDLITCELPYTQTDHIWFAPHYGLTNLAGSAGAMHYEFMDELINTEAHITCLTFKDSGSIPHLELENVTHQTVDMCFREYIAKQLNITPCCNLLQGPYQIQKKYSAFTKSLSVGMPALMFACFIGTFAYQYHQLKTITQTLSQENFNVYKRFFPNATTMVSPRFRIEQALKQQTNNHQSQQLFSLLTTISPQLAAHTSDIKINSYHYQAKAFTISLIAPSFSELEKLQQALEKDAVTVQQLSAQNNNKQIEAVWRLSK